MSASPVPRAMDAHTTAALATVLHNTNCAAMAENLRMRRALLQVRQAVLEGNRARALFRLRQALNEPFRAPPRRRSHLLCAACGSRTNAVWQVEAIGRWHNLPPHQRQLCQPCYSMQPCSRETSDYRMP